MNFSKGLLLAALAAVVFMATSAAAFVFGMTPQVYSDESFAGELELCPDLDHLRRFAVDGDVTHFRYTYPHAEIDAQFILNLADPESNSALSIMSRMDYTLPANDDGVLGSDHAEHLAQGNARPLKLDCFWRNGVDGTLTVYVNPANGRAVSFVRSK